MSVPIYDGQKVGLLIAINRLRPLRTISFRQTRPPTQPRAGRYARGATTSSPRVRAYEMTEDLPDDVVDDLLPTGHQQDVSEGDQPVSDRASQNRSLDDLKNGQILP